MAAPAPEATVKGCAHTLSVHVIGNAIHEADGASQHGPLLLWCAACGALAWSDGGDVLIYTTDIEPAGRWLTPPVPRGVPDRR
jgi:hypothetical protein